MIKQLGHRRIRLAPAHNLDSSHLIKYLEPLYLSEPQTIEFAFDKRYLEKIEKAFDVLIQKHGVRDVEFVYIIE